MKYKALLADVDGTLIVTKRNALPTPRVIDAIDKASHLINIGVATSRPYYMLSRIFEHIHLNGPSVIIGGTRIIDSKTNTVLWEQEIFADDVLAIIPILKKHDVHFVVNEDGDDVYVKNHYKPKKPLAIYVFDIEESLADTIISEITYIPTIAVHKIISFEKGKVGLDIAHVLATKQHGIVQVAKILCISTHEIIGVGDGPNDFPLLMASGLKVAMGNAIDDLKAIADYVAPSVEEDGLADVIEKFVLHEKS